MSCDDDIPPVDERRDGGVQFIAHGVVILFEPLVHVPEGSVSIAAPHLRELPVYPPLPQPLLTQRGAAKDDKHPGIVIRQEANGVLRTFVPLPVPPRCFFCLRTTTLISAISTLE